MTNENENIVDEVDGLKIGQRVMIKGTDSTFFEGKIGKIVGFTSWDWSEEEVAKVILSEGYEVNVHPTKLHAVADNVIPFTLTPVSDHIDSF